LAQPVSDTLEFPLLTLMNNVDKLTRPYTDRIELEENGKTNTVTVEHPALLDQLNESILSSQSLGRRGSTLASQRNVLDASAYMLQHAIEQALKLMWAQYNDKPMPKDHKRALQAWHTHFRKQVTDRQLTADNVWKHVRHTSNWIKQIETKFDPPITLEVTRPCPDCGHQFVYNEHNERVSAVIVTWQRSFDKSLATCRGCDKSWVGESELRQLRYDIDQKDSLWSEDL
jgi:hypothetical protein